MFQPSRPLTQNCESELCGWVQTEGSLVNSVLLLCFFSQGKLKACAKNTGVVNLVLATPRGARVSLFLVVRGREAWPCDQELLANRDFCECWQGVHRTDWVQFKSGSKAGHFWPANILVFCKQLCSSQAQAFKRKNMLQKKAQLSFQGQSLNPFSVELGQSSTSEMKVGRTVEMIPVAEMSCHT